MATRSPMHTDLNRRATTVVWTGLLNGDTGTPWGGDSGIADRPDKSVQVFGTFSTGGQVDIEGSNDGGTTWFVLHNDVGAPLSITAAGGHRIAEVCEQMRPNCSGGDGSTDLDCAMFGSV